MQQNVNKTNEKQWTRATERFNAMILIQIWPIHILNRFSNLDNMPTLANVHAQMSRNNDFYSIYPFHSQRSCLQRISSLDHEKCWLKIYIDEVFWGYCFGSKNLNYILSKHNNHHDFKNVFAPKLWGDSIVNSKDEQYKEKTWYESTVCIHQSLACEKLQNVTNIARNIWASLWYDLFDCNFLSHIHSLYLKV